MTDRNDMLAWIEEALGSNGSREVAEKIFDLLKADGLLTFNEKYGFVLDLTQMSDQHWMELLKQVAE